jgi:hypothetical protein
MNLECLRLLHQEPVPESGTRLEVTILLKKLRTQVVLNLLVLRPLLLHYLLLKKRQAKRMLIGLVLDGHLGRHRKLAHRPARDHHGPSGISEKQ